MEARRWRKKGVGVGGELEVGEEGYLKGRQRPRQTGRQKEVMCVPLCGGRRGVVGGKQLAPDRSPKSMGAENTSPLAAF